MNGTEEIKKSGKDVFILSNCVFLIFFSFWMSLSNIQCLNQTSSCRASVLLEADEFTFGFH